MDVRRRRGDDGAPARQHRLQREDVRARAVEDRVGDRVVTEVAPHDLLQPLRVVVRTVGALVAAVGRGERLDDAGVHPRVVVGREVAPRGVVQRLERFVLHRRLLSHRGP